MSADRVGLFANFRDAIAEASFRAAITGHRATVTYEPNNAWWQVRDSGPRLGSESDQTRPWLGRRFLELRDRPYPR